MYDDFSIELARKRGAPDPEGNARLANEVLSFLNRAKPDFDSAEKVLARITDPVIVRDLKTMIEIDRHWRCIPPP